MLAKALTSIEHTCPGSVKNTRGFLQQVLYQRGRGQLYYQRGLHVGGQTTM